MIHLHGESKVVILIETESIIVVARAGELLFSEYGVSVFQDENLQRSFTQQCKYG